MHCDQLNKRLLSMSFHLCSLVCCSKRLLCRDDEQQCRHYIIHIHYLTLFCFAYVKQMFEALDTCLLRKTHILYGVGDDKAHYKSFALPCDKIS